MSTLSQNLSTLVSATNDIKSAIQSKGGSVSGGLTSCASAILNISQTQEIVDIPAGTKFGYSIWYHIPSSVQNYVKQRPDLSEYFAYCWNLSSVSLTGLSVAYDMTKCFQYCWNLTSISLTGLSNVGYAASCFAYCKGLTSISLDLPAVENMSCCFHYCSNLTSISLTGLSNVTNMSYCFQYCSSLTSVSLNLPKVTGLASAFAYCSSLTSVSLTGLSNVTTVGSCFVNCRSLTSVSLDIPKVNYAASCFVNCTTLTSVSLSFSPTAANSPFLSNCFSACRSLETVTLIGISFAQTFYNCFSDCTSLQNLYFDVLPPETNLDTWRLEGCTLLTHDSLMNVVNALPTVTSGTHPCKLGTTNLNKLTDEEKAIATNKGWTLN